MQNVKLSKINVMKKLLFVFTFIAMLMNTSKAQHDLITIKVINPVYSNDRFFNPSISIDKGFINLAFFRQMNARIELEDKTLYKNISAVEELTLGLDGQIFTDEFHVINLNDLGYFETPQVYKALRKDFLLGKSQTDASYQELSQQFPQVLNQPVKRKDFYITEFGRNSVSAQVLLTEFDRRSNYYAVKTGLPQTVKLINTNQDGLERVPFGYILVNKDMQKIVTLTGRRYPRQEVRKDKSKKFNEYRQYVLEIYDPHGQLLNTSQINFTYPKHVIYYKNLYQPSTNTQVGYLFIFGYATGLGKKYNNPQEKNLFIAAVFDNDGNLMYKKELTLPYGADFSDAFLHNGYINIIASSSRALIDLIKLNQQEIKHSVITINGLADLTIGNSHLGFERNYMSDPDMNKPEFLQVNPDGSFVEVFSKKVTPSNTDGQTGPSKIFYYAVLFDNKGNVTRQIIFPRGLNNDFLHRRKIHLAYNSPDKLVFILEEKIGTLKQRPYNITPINFSVIKALRYGFNGWDDGTQNFPLRSIMFVKCDLPKNKIYFTYAPPRFVLINEPHYFLHIHEPYYWADNFFVTDTATNSIYVVGANTKFNKLLIMR